MTDRVPGDDPGWGSLGRILLGVLVPWLGARRVAKERNALVALRSLFLTFAVAQLLIGVVVLVLHSGADDRDASIDAGVAVAGVAAIGLVLVVVSWALLRRLPCGDVGQLVGAYRTRFFLRIAFAEMSTLLGFTATFLADSPLPYFAGLLPAAIGFARLAPTRANLQREDDELLAQGCPHSLYRTLLDAELGDAAGG